MSLGWSLVIAAIVGVAVSFMAEPSLMVRSIDFKIETSFSSSAAQ
jgi:hypothetical protein